MVCVQVIGNDAAIGIAGSQGNFELNVFKPVMILNFLHSVDLLTDACRNFRRVLRRGHRAEPGADRRATCGSSLMLVTALNPHIGYDKAAAIAKKAHKEARRCGRPRSQLGHLTGRGVRRAGPAREDDRSRVGPGTTRSRAARTLRSGPKVDPIAGE